MTFSHKISLGVGIVIVLLLSVFLMLNRQPTEVNFIVGTFAVSRAFLVLGFFAAGVLTGWLSHSIFRLRRHPSPTPSAGDSGGSPKG